MKTTNAETPEAARPGADPVPRALTAISVLLTIGTAATDVACFTRLGGVFASVMTSNLVFLGLSAARHSGALAARSSVAVAAYVTGVAAASRLARAGPRARAPDDPAGAARPGGSGGQPWSAWIAGTLLVEIALLAMFTAGWESTGTKPEGGAQLLLLVAAAVAMGIQSGVVAVLGVAGVSTTYLTGTLTTLIDALASPQPRPGANVRRAAALCALVGGAALGGLLLATVPAAVPAVPLATLAGAIIAGTLWLRPAPADRRPANRRAGNGEWSRSPTEGDAR
jgi:uncharacterized membrane protein YoaK (UPF0700 family)